MAERLGRWSSGRGPLYVLLAARLRQLIDDAELPPGTPLPPDRQFASSLAVGRSTVVAAYDLLEAEGRIVRRQGSGTRVAGSAESAVPDTTGAPMFLHLIEPRPEVISLACAAPDAPPPEIAEAYARIVPELATMTGEIGYHPAGYLPLRTAIADRYTRLGAPTLPEQILVTNGGQQALTLLARAHLRPGDRVLLETPTYPGALEAFQEASAVLHPLPLGLAGFEAAARAHHPKLAYVTPTFQNPTGAVLSALVRRRLAEAAEFAAVPLIVDEVLADLAFPGEPTPPPVAADVDSVITISSLSKNLWGGLRVGWIRATPALIARLARLRAVGDLGGNLPAQMAATHLVADLDTLCRTHAVHRKTAHDTLLAALSTHLPDWLPTPVRGGQSLWFRLPHGDGNSFAQTALRHNIAILAGNGLDITGASNDHIRLHFRHPPEVLHESVTRLAAAWHAYHPPARKTAPPPAFAI
ncbi:PLP-dependent aminotransferase family protein [Nocardia sp. XZ_19_385]|uniref:aminotransferase-like domain-containing protein n=1 Tax=Nocardia sp. XZ_19_385 TaxID=2769488 RepID=UPI0028168724|nr:PLP-dependent aminotransferase family protein [Nocardia sp. XZ_19_385]